MQKYLFIDPIYKNHISFFLYQRLYEKLEEELGFKILFSNKISLLENADLVIAIAQRNYSIMNKLSELNNKTKLIAYVRDPHIFKNTQAHPVRKNFQLFAKNFLDRADFIFCSKKSFFEQNFPSHKSKFSFIPNYILSDFYKDLFPGNFTKRKCLLSGEMFPKKVYKFRNLVLQNRDFSKIDYISHPGRHLPQKSYFDKESFVNEKYAHLLNSYLCCFTDSSVFKYPLAKYFEIMASGSLLLGEQIPDLDDLGFIPFEHYIPVTPENVFLEIDKYVKTNLSDFIEIINNGRKLVLENHTVENRFNQIKTFLDSF